MSQGTPDLVRPNSAERVRMRNWADTEELHQMYYLRLFVIKADYPASRPPYIMSDITYLLQSSVLPYYLLISKKPEQKYQL